MWPEFQWPHDAKRPRSQPTLLHHQVDNAVLNAELPKGQRRVLRVSDNESSPGLRPDQMNRHLERYTSELVPRLKAMLPVDRAKWNELS
jgi:hypothetical protein